MNIASFDLLRVLIAVAESKNFREAAEKLKISQPAVSVKLKELETQHPLPLFNIEGKRKVLTHYGRALYEASKDGASALDRKIESLHRIYSAANLRTIRIGGRNKILEYVAPLLEFAGRIEFLNLSSKDAVDKLRSHEIDIAISYLRPDSADLQAKKLFASKAYFSVHEKFLTKRKLNRELIKDQEFLLGTPCVSYLRDGHLISDWAKHAGVSFADLNVRMITEDWGTVQSLIDQGIGYGILPSYVQSHSPHVHRIELPDNVIRSMDFFAIFESNLRKVQAFQPILAFARFRQK